MRAALLAPCLLLAACRSVEISPAALRAPGGRPAQRAEGLARWEEAVAHVNAFLASPFRRTLPAGRFTLADDGLAYVTDDGCTWPIAVLSTTWGDLVVATGFRAQEAACGFVVGTIDEQPDEAFDPLLDNTFFRSEAGTWQDADSLASLILHETTHVVFREGTVGPWNTLGYYVVAAVTFSGADHPAEDRPRATSEEYAWWSYLREAGPDATGPVAAVRDEHLAQAHEDCEHGPFPPPECP